jgi:hypothetical protein
MTRRSSVRAQARRNYCALAGKAGAKASAPTPDPPPPCFGGASPSPRTASARGRGDKKETKLTKRVRALYEDSAVPVREIARLAGVTERTIYKYVARHGWTKRYRTPPRGKPPELFAPVKGAGGRFIRREDNDKPVATGLKATDPAGARRAAARCGGAAHLAARAQADALTLQLFERQIRANECTNLAVKNLREYREQRARKGKTGSGDRIEAMLTHIVEVSLNHWEAALAQLRNVQRGEIGTS